ncbi:HAD family hydrolase [Actinomadura meridiana]
MSPEFVPPGYEGFLAMVFRPRSRDARRVGGSFPVDPECADAVRDLHELGLGLVVASNTRPGQSRHHQLAVAGVRGLLREVLHSHELGVAKPDHKFFEAVVAAAGCPASEVCYVGDRVRTDVVPAVAAGMRAVLVAPSGQSSETPDRWRGASGGVPDSAAVISHMRELPALLARTAAA